MRWLFAACIAALLFAGCGEERESAPAGSAKAATPAATKACLEDRGLKVAGGESRPDADDNDAPDRGELITAGAFIAFYSSTQRADALAGGVSANASRLKARVVRHGPVTVLYLDDRSESAISGCLPTAGTQLRAAPSAPKVADPNVCERMTRSARRAYPDGEWDDGEFASGCTEITIPAAP
jgi:hypothetical protein